MKTWIVPLGIGTALGAIAILVMPRDNPTRKLATQAASKVEDAAAKIGNKLNITTKNS